MLKTVWHKRGLFKDCNHLVIDEENRVHAVMQNGDIKLMSIKMPGYIDAYVKRRVWVIKMLPEECAWLPVNNYKKR